MTKLVKFNRLLDLNNFKSSAFIFGPRMTGKTFLINLQEWDLKYDLLDVEVELALRSRPSIFWDELRMLKRGSRVAIDEIQRAPVLLNYVQKAIEELNHYFVLSGSSARKLKRGAANLLGGRALDLKLHPLGVEEMGDMFSIDLALRYGTLPAIYLLALQHGEAEVIQRLWSYSSIYIKEEIQLEALTRNVGAFQRFLSVAAQCNGQIIEYSNIASDCSVPASTVKEYFSILEDTLIASLLWPWDRSERKKAHPKLYFFDCGILRAIQNRLKDPPTPVEKGFLFETWLYRELVRIRDYSFKQHEISLWRKGKYEIDFLISGGYGPLLAIECKSGRVEIDKAAISLFRKQFPKTRMIICSLEATKPRKSDLDVEILPLRETLELYKSL